ALTQAMAAAAGAAWEANNSWSKADLGAVIEAGDNIGADVRVTDNAGRVIRASPGFSRGAPPAQSADVMVRGQRVGGITVRLVTGSGLPAADSVLRSALLRAIAGAAGLAALLALLAGLLAARRVTPRTTPLIAGARATSA